ncbi:hypothetical protein [Roseovarius sp.]|uniref:hypothetical protein n=1 Tax=Roseovarius sp. TaxID=1486281 RepID=UPI00257C47DD|nr:hypothetical protein [Roseovarius sp.]
MPIYYSYSQMILGSQTSMNGGAPDYDTALTAGHSWSWTGAMSTGVVYEAASSAVNFNGDPDGDDEGVGPVHDIGGENQQSMEIGGVDRRCSMISPFR